MTTTEITPALLDHVEVRIVNLDPDHPGFRDLEYRARRNAIAGIATNYRPGDPIPRAPYTELEDQVWQQIWTALGPAHRAHACAEYLDCLERLDFGTDRIPQLDEVSRLRPEYPEWMFTLQGSDRQPGQVRDWSKMMKS